MYRHLTSSSGYTAAAICGLKFLSCYVNIAHHLSRLRANLKFCFSVEYKMTLCACSYSELIISCYQTLTLQAVLSHSKYVTKIIT